MTHLGNFDLGIVGGGIVGLATAYQAILAQPDRRIVLLEAESSVGKHQSGHNSGVLHSGIYYKPGSLKATLCRDGKSMMESFCRDHDVPFDRCGKVIVATNAAEVESLDRIEQRGIANGVQLSRITADQLHRLEPAAAGIAAIHVPETGIVDYHAVCDRLRQRIESIGVTVRTAARVTRIETSSVALRITAGDQTVDVSQLISCAGLQADRIFRLAGGTTTSRIIPFRGEYYELIPSRHSLCRNLIYPVPDPSFPFLGVHFTRMIGGGVECGPNAVLALSRHGYRWRDVNPRDLVETIAFGGFRTIARKHWRMGMGEIWRSVNKRAFVAALQKLIPSIQAADLVTGRAGVRAQAVDASGNLVDDFLIERTARAIHVLNAPSPAATASLAIGKEIMELAQLPR